MEVKMFFMAKYKKTGRFQNPANDYIEVGYTGWSHLWAFFFTPLYYAVKGIWTHAIVSLILHLTIGVSTLGIGSFFIGLVYAFANPSIIRAYYLRKNWVEVEE